MSSHFVTGASSGLGLELCKTLLSQGQHVLGLSRSEPKIKNDLFQWIQCDLSQTDKLQEVIQSIPQEIKMKSLVNNAGTLDPMGLFQDAPLEQIEKHFQINLSAPLLLTRLLLDKMDRSSHIINISSGAASSIYPGWAAYCSSKAGLDQFTQVLAEEIPNGPEILAFRPGVIDTPMQDAIRTMEERNFPKKNKFVELKESGKLLAPQYVAKILTWLITRESHEFHGQIIDIRDEEFLKKVPSSILKISHFISR